MPTYILSNFLENSGNKPYRELIQHHIKASPEKKIMEGCLGTINFLPPLIRHNMMAFIDEINFQFATNKYFWESADCNQALNSFIDVAIDVLPLSDYFSSPEQALNPENQDLAFNIFQICTLNFAYSAYSQPKQRKFMGIKKGCWG